MTSPGSPPAGFYFPVLSPADIEWLALFFLTPLMAPTPVATRLPDTTLAEDTVNGFIRVEAGGGMKRDYLRFNQTILLHTYVPNEYEPQGAEIAGKAMAYMSAATGCQVAGWQISDVPHCSPPQRRTDPQVNMLRFLSYVTWTVSGRPVVCALNPEPIASVPDLSGTGSLSGDITN